MTADFTFFDILEQMYRIQISIFLKSDQVFCNIHIVDHNHNLG